MTQRLSEQSAELLRGEIAGAAAEVNVATARLALLAADADRGEAWGGVGFRSCAHWLTITTGLDLHSTGRLLQAGHALAELPRLRAAFECGQLSLDKLLALSRVAVAADEAMWLEVALDASGDQLTRICRAVARAGAADDRPAERTRARGVWARWFDDGLTELRALLAPDDAAVVMRALDALGDAQVQERAGCPSTGRSADDPVAARRADALVLIAETVAAAVDATPPDPAATTSPARPVPPARLVVHVDAAVLAAQGAGRCHLEDGAALSPSVLRRIGCDAEVQTLVERDGTPINAGRRRRIVTGRLRLALQARDRTCRFPGCGVPASRTHGHHVRHWADGGRTDLVNLLSLCGFHHRSLHDGDYRIERAADGRPQFRTSAGRPIAPRNPARDVEATAVGPLTSRVVTESPMARAGGERLDLDHAVFVINARAQQLRGAVTTAAIGRPPPTPG